MARLDRLGEAKEIAQLGATIGREFSYELLQAVASVDELALQGALGKLVDSELLYQRGLLPQAQYVFKHALIQDTAYQSLLKSTRQKVSPTDSADIGRTASRDAKRAAGAAGIPLHRGKTHRTGHSLLAKGWGRAGQRSANMEAMAHLTKGLELLKALPDLPSVSSKNLTLQIALGSTLQVTQGYAAPEGAQAYARARELCRQLGETPQLLPVLGGL